MVQIDVKIENFADKKLRAQRSEPKMRQGFAKSQSKDKYVIIYTF